MPGDPRIRVENLKQNQPPPRERVEPGATRNPVLAAYRAVLLNDEKQDRLGLEATARVVLKKDERGFLAKYDELERREQAEEEVRAGVVEKQASVAGPGADEGEDRVLELLGVLLAEWPGGG